MKKISLIKKNLNNLIFAVTIQLQCINLRYKIFAITLELNCNGKNLIIPIFLDQTDFFQKWFSLVPLYMWVTYELI